MSSDDAVRRAGVAVELGKGRVDQLEPAGRLGLQRPPGGDRVGIAVDRDDLRSRCQQRPRVAAGAESAVDDARAGERLQGSQHLLEQDRDVAGRSANGAELVAVARHHPVSPAGPEPEPPGPAPCLSRRSRSRTDAPCAFSRSGSQI